MELEVKICRIDPKFLISCNFKQWDLDWFIYWVINQWTDWIADWLNNWMIFWLTDLFILLPIPSLDCFGPWFFKFYIYYVKFISYFFNFFIDIFDYQMFSQWFDLWHSGPAAQCGKGTLQNWSGQCKRTGRLWRSSVFHFQAMTIF